MKNMSKQTQQIINRLLNFGAGFVLLLIGCLTMTLSNHLGLDYPAYIIVGCVEVVIGSIIYILDAVLRFYVKIKEIHKESTTNEKIF